MADFERLEIGMIIDVVISRHNQQTSDSNSSSGKPTIRKASQADWDRFSS